MQLAPAQQVANRMAELEAELEQRTRASTRPLSSLGCGRGRSRWSSNHQPPSRVRVAESESMATVYPAARNLCAAATYSKLRSNNRATLDPAGGPEARWPREWS
eukprot:scaffold4813_cov77-Phaeocystis_antarctica.AAC.2